METAGIVAEYNPFHNGHAWQLAALKKQLGDVSVVACMSGAFVQRGEAAIASPLVRAEMAIRGGIDLVLELPVAYSLRSADYFAAGAVQTLAATGLVTHLVCGIENPVTEDIFPEQNSTSEPGQEPQSKTDEGSRQEPQPGSKQGIKLNQAQEQGPDTNFPKPRLPFAPPLPETAKWSLTAEAESRVHLFTQAGFSYAAAWEKAAEAWQNGASFWFSSPNNILALAYQKAILQHSKKMQLHLLPRQGSGYKQEVLTPPYASAAAIRQALSEATVFPGRQPFEKRGLQTELAQVLPATTLSLLEKPEVYPRLFSRQENILTLLLTYCLFETGSRQLFEHSSAGLDLCHRFYKTREALDRGYRYFCRQVANKRDSLPMVQRLALQLLLRRPRGFWLQPPPPSYIRVLAFNDRGRQLLKKMKETATLPTIIKLSDSLRSRELADDQLLQTDLAAADLYQLLSGNTGMYGTALRSSPFYLVQ